MTYTYQYQHPAVTVDLTIFTVRDSELHVLLIRRGLDPFKDAWALPGGFAQIDEDLETAACRELKEETGLSGIPIEQFYTFSAVDRDPRERVITVAYRALVPSDKLVLSASTDAADAVWHSMDKLPRLAFDHDAIIKTALSTLRSSIQRDRTPPQDTILAFLPEEFTLSALEKVYSTIQGKPTDKRNFRNWINAAWSLEPTGKKVTFGRHRPAELYRAASKLRSAA